MTRCPRLGGYATTGGRHAGAGASLPGGARCSRMVLHLPLPNQGGILAGGGGKTTAWGAGCAEGSLATEHTESTEWGMDCGLRRNDEGAGRTARALTRDASTGWAAARLDPGWRGDDEAGGRGIGRRGSGGDGGAGRG